MLINSAQKIPSFQRKISIEFRDPAHQLSADILGSYLWRYLYLPSVSRLIHEHWFMYYPLPPAHRVYKSQYTQYGLFLF